MARIPHSIHRLFSAQALVGAREVLRFGLSHLRVLLFWPLCAALLTALGWFLLMLKLDEDQADAERFALAEANTLARAFADDVSRTFHNIDQQLLLLRLQWIASAGEFRLEHSEEHGLFPDGDPFEATIIDRAGHPLTRTRNRTGLPRVEDYRQRPSFRAQQNSGRDALYISPPMMGAAWGHPRLQFSRPLLGPGGRFDGMVLMGARHEYFTASYDPVALGQQGVLALAGRDGAERVIRVGKTVLAPGVPLFAAHTHLASAEGAAKIAGPAGLPDHRTRYLGWKEVDGYPFLAIAGLSEDEVLLPFRNRRAASLREASLISAAVLLFTLMATVLSLRLGWRKHQMELMQTTYRMATEAGNEGFYIARPLRDRGGHVIDYQVTDCNQRGAELFQRRREEMIGMHLTALYTSFTPTRGLKMLNAAMERGCVEDEFEVMENSPLPARWVHVKAVRSNDALAITMRDISDAKAHMAELERRSNEDGLTGLPNRHWVHTMLPRALEAARAGQQMVAILFVDLDGFKTVNDTLGHAAGDEVLRAAGRRLTDAVRPHDVVARFGGDEFVVLLENLPQREDAAHVAERILRAFLDEFRFQQGAHPIGTSIGISLYPSDSTDANTLLEQADLAMYAVKTGGKRNYRFYDRAFEESLRGRLHREAELRQAIARDEFEMWYQPRRDLASGRICSLEALVRWRHPERGLLEPLEFIELAESNGMIVELGALVIDKVCAQVALWTRTGAAPLPVSINVSPRQFNESRVAQLLGDAIGRHGIHAPLIEVELTESSMMGDSTEIAGALMAIRYMGITLLVDDFGTGYSSLSQLQRLDFDILKIDRAFTHEIDKAEAGKIFFRAIVTMAHALGMRVVAEGVETEAQMVILRSLGCDEAQGYVISRPVPAEEVQLLLAEAA